MAKRKQTIFDVATEQELIHTFWGKIHVDDDPKEVQAWLKIARDLVHNDQDVNLSYLAQYYAEHNQYDKAHQCIGSIHNAEVRLSIQMLIFECADRASLKGE